MSEAQKTSPGWQIILRSLKSVRQFGKIIVTPFFVTGRRGIFVRRIRCSRNPFQGEVDVESARITLKNRGLASAGREPLSVNFQNQTNRGCANRLFNFGSEPNRFTRSSAFARRLFVAVAVAERLIVFKKHSEPNHFSVHVANRESLTTSLGIHEQRDFVRHRLSQLFRAGRANLAAQLVIIRPAHLNESGHSLVPALLRGNAEFGEYRFDFRRGFARAKTFFVCFNNLLSGQCFHSLPFFSPGLTPGRLFIDALSKTRKWLFENLKVSPGIPRYAA